MSKEAAQAEAIRQAVARVQQVDLVARCALLRLPAPAGETLTLRVFGSDVELNTRSFELCHTATGKPANAAARILLLHLLLCDLPLQASEELVSFRDFPGGMFYLEPFLSRSVRPLVRHHGDRLDGLRAALNRFDYELLDLGDLSARIHALGCLYVTLIYRLGDSEFPTEAELLFNLPTRRALCAEDAAVLAGQICFGLF
jgi:hypothetical protein